MLKGDLARLQEEAKHTQELKNLARQEEGAAARLSYERLLADKRVIDTRLDETEVTIERRRIIPMGKELYTTTLTR